MNQIKKVIKHNIFVALYIIPMLRGGREVGGLTKLNVVVTFYPWTL